MTLHGMLIIIRTLSYADVDANVVIGSSVGKLDLRATTKRQIEQCE